MKTVAFTGHRPKNLCGYDTAAYTDFVHELAMYLTSLYPGEGLRVITGGAQGIDQLAFWAADLAKDRRTDITNIVYVPFRGQSSIWKATGLFSRSEYGHMLDAADEVRYLAEKPAERSEIIKALHGRNHQMVDAADEVIAVYRGTDYANDRGGTAECMRYAEAKGKPIRVVSCKAEGGKLTARFP